jgi:hypothetical protein
MDEWQAKMKGECACYLMSDELDETIVVEKMEVK